MRDWLDIFRQQAGSVAIAFGAAVPLVMGAAPVAIDAPIMGSVDPKERAFTYWAGVNNDMVFSEYLIDVATLPPRGAFYIFLHPKIENTHGGPGRAIAILPIGKRMQKQASLRP